jgi:hypothetical protein
MTAVTLRFLLVACGGPLACALTCIGVLYSAWRLSRRSNGWDR